MKIALTIPTGRPRVKKVVKAFIDNVIHYGHNPKNFSVYLSIDTTYRGTRVRDFKLDSDLEEMLGKVDYISPQSRRELGQEILERTNADKKVIDSLFVGRGYSKQRNSALLLALRDENDVAICVDDDEVPYIPVINEKNEVYWENPDFFTPHIELLKSCDVTSGLCIGYISPIPSGIEAEVPEDIRKKLGWVLQEGNEVINENSFVDIMNKLIYLPESELYSPSLPYIVERGKFGNAIFGGNMGINLDSVSSGKIPIFFTPPQARGEDTFFGLQLKKLEVAEVPSYIFHDPFNLYPEVLKKKFPEKLDGIPLTKDSKKRFGDAVIGWLKYAPLFIHMTSSDIFEREERIKSMLSKIKEPTDNLAEILKCPALRNCKGILEKYADNVEDHYDSLLRAQKVWRREVIPAFCGVKK